MARTRELLDLTAGDVMKPPADPIPQTAKVAEAARLLRHSHAFEAPVVDGQGRCVGVLSASELMLRVGAESAARGDPSTRIRTCSFQKQGALASGEEAVVCTLPEGSCPLQVARQTREGGTALFCQDPHCVLADWQVIIDDVPEDEVRRYAKPVFAFVRPSAHLTRVARMMADARITRVHVLDGEDRPVGVITSHDVLSEVAALEPRTPDLEGG